MSVTILFHCTIYTSSFVRYYSLMVIRRQLRSNVLTCCRSGSNLSIKFQTHGWYKILATSVLKVKYLRFSKLPLREDLRRYPHCVNHLSGFIFLWRTQMIYSWLLMMMGKKKVVGSVCVCVYGTHRKWLKIRNIFNVPIRKWKVRACSSSIFIKCSSMRERLEETGWHKFFDPINVNSLHIFFSFLSTASRLRDHLLTVLEDMACASSLVMIKLQWSIHASLFASLPINHEQGAFSRIKNTPKVALFWWPGGKVTFRRVLKHWMHWWIISRDFVVKPIYFLSRINYCTRGSGGIARGGTR